MRARGRASMREVPPSSPPATLMSYADLAKWLDVNVEVLRKWLDRELFLRQPDLRRELADRKPRETRYLWVSTEVEQFVRQKLAKKNLPLANLSDTNDLHHPPQ